MKTIYLLSLLFCFNLFANEAATVLILHGTVTAKAADGKSFSVKKDDKIKVGMVLETGEKSFVKLIFIDKSQMNLGPNSKMEVTAFPKNEAGIINLVKGELRSKVSKDYMNMDKKDQSKLFIKTKTAAMGVRGTDFKVIYNEDNNITSLVTFEGRVSMAAVDERSAPDINVNQRVLEQAVSAPEAQMVTQGQYSGVNPTLGQGQATEPVKINPQQLESLRSNDTGIREKSPDSASSDGTKSFRSPIPPGVDSKTFANTSNALEKKLEGSVNAQVMPNTADGKQPESPTAINSQMSGGFIDLKTSLYIPPPPGSAYDPNTGMYTPPPSYGSVGTNGEYISPKGFELKATGEFVEVKTEIPKDGRAPASQTAAAPPAPMNVNTLQNIAFNSSNSEFSGLANQPLNGPGRILGNICIECMQKDIQREVAERQQQTIQEVSTRVRFNVNAGP